MTSNTFTLRQIGDYPQTALMVFLVYTCCSLPTLDDFLLQAQIQGAWGLNRLASGKRTLKRNETASLSRYRTL